MSASEQRPKTPPAPFVEDAPESPMDGAGAGDAGQTETTARNADNSATPPAAQEPAQAPDASGRIQIIVKDQTGNQVGFALKPNTRMAKVMSAYADRQGRDVRSLRFFFDGDRVLDDSTPASLEMNQDDIIEVQTEQLGGGLLPRKILADREISVGDVKEMEGAKGDDLEEDDEAMTEKDDKEPFPISVSAVTTVTEEPTDLTKTTDFSSDEAKDDNEPVTLESKPRSTSDLVFITVHFGSKHVHVRMNVSTTFKQIIDNWAQDLDEDPRHYHLTHKGNVIFNNDTPDLVGLKTGDQLVMEDDGELLFLDLAKV